MRRDEELRFDLLGLRSQYIDVEKLIEHLDTSIWSLRERFRLNKQNTKVIGWAVDNILELLEIFFLEDVTTESLAHTRMLF